MSHCIICVSGPQGAGKDSLILYVRRILTELQLGPKATTRKPRPDDIDPLTNAPKYDYVSVEEFQSMLASGRIAEHAEVNGNFYGSYIEPTTCGVEIRDIDVKGALQLRDRSADDLSFPRIVMVGILPPCGVTVEQLKAFADFEVLGHGAFDASMSMMETEVLRRMVEVRGDDEQTARAKLKRTPEEVRLLCRHWDTLIINDQLEVAGNELLAICRDALADAEDSLYFDRFRAYSGSPG